MANKAEVREYGLLVPDDQLLSAPVCKVCRAVCQVWPGKDWLGCFNCLVGMSRLERCSPEWKEKLSDAEKSLAGHYLEEFVTKRNAAFEFWFNLAHGTAIKGLWPRVESMATFVRALTNEEEISQLEKMTGQEVLFKKLPMLLMRLDDIPGRLTGFAVFNTNKKATDQQQVFPVTSGPKVAFLQIYPKPIIAISKLGEALRIQSSACSLGLAKFPVVFADTSERPWRPAMKSTVVLAEEMATPEFLRNASEVEGAWVPSGSINEWVPSPSRISNWYDKVISEADEWKQLTANKIAGMPPDNAFYLLKDLQLTETEIADVLSRCPPGKKEWITSAISHRPLCYRLHNKKVIYDDGKSWIDHTGELVLSVSFSVLRVTRDDSGKVEYHCRIKSQSLDVLFSAGKEMERDAFSVIMREGLIHGFTVQCNRAYTKQAIEIAVGLRPLQSTTPANLSR